MIAYDNISYNQCHANIIDYWHLWCRCLVFFPFPPLFPGFLTIATTSHLLFHGLSGLFLHLYLATSGPN